MNERRQRAVMGGSLEAETFLGEKTPSAAVLRGQLPDLSSSFLTAPSHYAIQNLGTE